MFEKNSAFSQKPEVESRLSHIRQATLANNSATERGHPAAQNTQNAAAYHLLTAAELMLEADDSEAASRLIHEAKMELDADSA